MAYVGNRVVRPSECGLVKVTKQFGRFATNLVQTWFINNFRIGVNLVRLHSVRVTLSLGAQVSPYLYLLYFVTDLVEIRYEKSPRHDAEQVGVLFKMSAVTHASYLVTH